MRLHAAAMAINARDITTAGLKGPAIGQALEAARDRHKVTLHWVKGHAGHPENERADELARRGMEPFKGKSSGGEA